METVIDNTTVKKYPAYKDSGIEWSGLVPENWGALPIRAILEERNEKNEGRKTDYILSVTKDRGVIPYDEKGAIGNNKSEDIERYKLVYPNDFVINKMNVVIGSLGMSKYFGAFSQVYLVYKPRTSQININYYSYIFSNPSFYKSLIKYCTGIMELRESLNKEDFKKLILPFPDYQTQTAIVEYLDRKTSLIDQAIDIKQKQIELLKERRQILIHKAVTRGLNPNVKMKDSGVEWIGEIPEAWEVVKLKYLSEFINDGTHGSFSRVEDGYRLLSVRNLVDDKFVFREDDSRVSEKHFKEISSKFQIRSGDINLAIVGATLGKVAIVDKYDELFVTQRSVCTIRVKEGVLLNSFLFYSIKSPAFQSYLWNNAGFSAQPGVYLGTIQSSVLSIPKIDEQKKIVDFLNETCLKYDTAISLKEQEIEKLKEYKATLINSAVTGKIKVI